MSKKKQNPLTENIGGGDDSQNRFKETFVIVRQFINYDTDDGFTYLTLKTFFDSVPEHKKVSIEDEFLRGLSVHDDFINDTDSHGHLVDTSFFSKRKAIMFQGKYFVLQDVS